MTSRKEDALRYLRTLEQEYLTCELRSLIYTRPTDRDYYLRVMALKRTNIERVADREKLPHMFNDATLWTTARTRFAGNGGIPNIYYKDYTDEQKFREADVRNYFQPGRRVLLADGTRGRCAGLCDDGRVRVRLEGHSRKSPTKICTRDQVARVFTPAAEAAEPVVAAEGGLVLIS
jgi:hypothetical protein